MRKAKEELRAETLKEMQKREDHLRSVLPPFNIESLDESECWSDWLPRIVFCKWCPLITEIHMSPVMIHVYLFMVDI